MAVWQWLTRVLADYRRRREQQLDELARAIEAAEQAEAQQRIARLAANSPHGETRAAHTRDRLAGNRGNHHTDQ